MISAQTMLNSGFSRRRVSLIVFLFISSLLSSCLLSNSGKTGRVTGYKNNEVQTKKGSYRVGTISDQWQTTQISKNLIALRNDSLQSTLTTNSFCDRAYNDSSLKNLTQQLLGGLQEVKIDSQKTFTLDARDAMRTQFHAKLDGVPVQVDTVVIKKNGCLFDFFLVSDPQNYAQAVQDFENFYQAFSYTEKD